MLTVCLAKKLANEEDMNLNKLVSGAHAFGVVFSAAVEIIFLWANTHTPLQVTENIESFTILTNSLLDVALCGMICHMVHENWQNFAPDADSDSELESAQPDEPHSESEGGSDSDFATFA